MLSLATLWHCCLPLQWSKTASGESRRCRLNPWSLGLLSVLLTAKVAGAAEKIEFFLAPVGSLPITITVKDLRQYAETGVASGTVQLYTRFAPKSQEAVLRSVLQQPFRVTPTTIQQFTATQLGNRMLRQVSQAIHLNNSSDLKASDSSQVLKAAMLNAAANPAGFTLLSFLEEYPQSTLQIDLRQSFVIVRELFKVFQQRDTVISALRQQAPADITALKSSPQKDLRQPGRHTWQVQTITVKNPDRQRTFPVDLYRPELTKSHQKAVPLVVISHGIASDRQTFRYLAEHLVSYGFAVAVVEHPGSSSEEIQRFFAGFDSLGGPMDWINRPRDITYLLDTLVANAKTEPAGKVPINFDQVGVLGQSFGGYTSLALAGAELNLNNLRKTCPSESSKKISLNIALLFQCEATPLTRDHYQLRDPRIKAIVAVNSIGSRIFGEAGIQKIDLPVLMISGSDDVIAPTIDEQILPFSWLKTPDKYLVLVEKATHFSFLEGKSADQVVRIPPELLGPDPNLAHPLLNALSTAFFQRYLRQDHRTDPILTEAYLPQISPPPFTASLFRQIDLQDLKNKSRVKQPKL